MLWSYNIWFGKICSTFYACPADNYFYSGLEIYCGFTWMLRIISHIFFSAPIMLCLVFFETKIFLNQHSFISDVDIIKTCLTLNKCVSSSKFFAISLSSIVSFILTILTGTINRLPENMGCYIVARGHKRVEYWNFYYTRLRQT